MRADGTVAGRGAEDGRTFELRDGRVDRSHLRANEAFPDGTTDRWKESSSPRRIEDDVPGHHSITLAFGLGVTSVNFTFGCTTFDRLFYERK